MDDDELFRRTMESLGVERPGEPRRRRGGARPPSEIGERSRSALERGFGKTPKAQRRLETPRRIKTPRRAPPVEDRLDLHRQKVDPALMNLSLFLRECVTEGLGVVVVVTGKGLHSRGGVGVLKPAVEGWIRHQGGSYVRAYCEAPRSQGGGGAFLLYLRSSSAESS